MNVAWAPQKGMQHAVMACPVYEKFVGGSRGPGKTDVALGFLGARAQRYGKRFNGLHIRHSMPQSDDVIERSKEIFGPMGAKYRDHPHREWRWPRGGRLRFRSLTSVEEARRYQGQNLSDIVVEEVGNYPDPAPVMALHACLRVARKTFKVWPDMVPPSLLLTGNPGGPGHHWLRARYVSPAPRGFKVIREQSEWNGISTEIKRVYIPGKVTENRLLDIPAYVAALQQVGSEALVRAWLDGDWDAILGQFFDCWNPARHVVRAFQPPAHWLRFRSFDWGSAVPFAVHWWAVATETHQLDDGRVLPKGALYAYREWYGAQKDASGLTVPNQGLKMTAEQVAQGIVQRELPGEHITYSVADPSIFATISGPSIRERMASQGVRFRPADNARVAQAGHPGGWDMVRQRLIGDTPDTPMIMFAHTCLDTIRTLPAMQHDEKHPEDLDTDSEDHAVDSVRYACMSRPWTLPKPVPPEDIKGLEHMQAERWFTDRERNGNRGEY